MAQEQLQRENFPFYNGQDFGMVEEDTVIQLSDNGINCWNISSRKVNHIDTQDRNGYSTVCTNLKCGLIAATEYGLQPKCHIFDSKTNQVLHTFAMDTKLKCLGMAFSRNGQYLTMIGGVPDFKISIYDLNLGALLNLPETCLPCNHKSFVEIAHNPKTENEFAILADQALYFFSVKPAFTYDQTEMEMDDDEEQPAMKFNDSHRLEKCEFLPDDVEVSEDNPPEGPIFFTSFKWDNFNRVHLCTNTEQILQVTTRVNATGVGPRVEDHIDLDSVPMTTLLTQKHLIVATESGGIYWYAVDIPYGKADEGLKLKGEEINYEYNFAEQLGENSAPASFMHYSRSHKKIIIGTRNGVMTRLDFEAQVPEDDVDEDGGDGEDQGPTRQTIDKQLEVLGRFHTAAVIAMKTLGDSSQLVTISKDMTMVIWEASSMQQISNIPQMTQPTSLASSLDGHIVFVGSEAGEFAIYDVSSRAAPRLIKQFRFYEDESPITSIQASENGKYTLISSNESDTIYIISQDVKQDFECYGFIKMEGYVLSCYFSYQRPDQPKIVAVLSNNLMQSVSIPTEVSEQRLEFLSNDVTGPLFRKIDRGSCHVIAHPKYKSLMVSGDDKHLKTYDLWPQEQFNKIDWRKAPVVPNEELLSHPLGISCYETLPNWLITGGKDGTIMVRDGTQPETGIEYECQAHSVAAGGITALSTFRGIQAIYTAGGDGSMAVWYIDGKAHDLPSQAFAPTTQRNSSLDKYQGEDQLPFEELLLCKEVMKEEFEKSKQRDKEVFKQEIELEREKIRERLEQLIANNHQVTDLEKLDPEDFVIDLDRQKRYMEDEESVCKDIRDEAEKTILKFELLRERVIDSTYNQMKSQAKACRSLMSEVLLHNYSIRSRSDNERTLLKQIVIQRKLELSGKYARQDKKANEAINETDFSINKEQYFMNRTTGRPDFLTDTAIELAAQKFKDEEEKRKQLRLARLEASKEKTVGEKKDGPRLVITKGKLNIKSRKGPSDDDSRGADKNKFATKEIRNMDSMHWRVVFEERKFEQLKVIVEKPETEIDIYDLLYDTFELYTDKRKRVQIEIVSEIIFKLKQRFNDEFSKLEYEKTECRFKIKECQEAINDLLDNLGSEPDKNTEIPTHILENPDHILKMDDSDITVERYYTAAERAAQAELERLRLEKEALLKQDNVGRRGLKAMYGVTELSNLNLKIDKGGDEDELEREDWMNKPEEEMNEEEKAKWEEFKQKLKTHEENKRRKWESELMKRRKEIDDIKHTFEETLLELYKKRLFYEARIYEQELYIIRMIIMLHEKRETHIDKQKFKIEREKLMIDLEKKTTYLENCSDYTTEFGENVKTDTSIQQHENNVKAYAKKENLQPREVLLFVQEGFPRAKVQVSQDKKDQMMDGIVALDPFSQIDTDVIKGKIAIMEEEEVYDVKRDCPADVDADDFKKYMPERATRMQFEKVKAENNKRLKQLNDHLGFLKLEKDSMQEEFDIIDTKCQKIEERANKLRFNFEVIVYLKQGQVEVPQLPVATDYKDGILIHESLISQENKKINKKGEEKVRKMNEILKAKTILKYHETDSQIKDLKIIDYEQRAMDVQLYRVTKQTQEIIMQKNVKKDEDIRKRLEHQIRALEDNTKKRINDITVKLKKMQRDMKDKDAENEELDRKARELKNQVEQRQQIIDLKSAGTNDNDQDKSKRFKVVANQRKMMDVIKQQEEEIMFLQDELDRLRARTFPSFAHLQNRDQYPDTR